MNARRGLAPDVERLGTRGVEQLLRLLQEPQRARLAGVAVSWRGAVSGRLLLPLPWMQRKPYYHACLENRLAEMEEVCDVRIAVENMPQRRVLGVSLPLEPVLALMEATGIRIDTAYLADTAVGSQDPAGPNGPGFGAAFLRVDGGEGAETATGGNGQGGGIYNDAAILSLTSSTTALNRAQGGSGQGRGNQGEGLGGGIFN